MKKTPTSYIERRVPATIWRREGARLRFPRATAAVIAWSVDDLGDPSMVVDIEIDRRHVEVPYDILRHGAESRRLCWHGRVRTRDDRAADSHPEHAVALVVVPWCQLRYSDRRVEPIPSHLSIELVDQPEVFHIELHELQRALLLPALPARMHRLLRSAARGSSSSPWTGSTVA